MMKKNVKEHGDDGSLVDSQCEILNRWPAQ